eukprot:INCI14597.2.p1 GENE.INCI14597.2~~INCI14597.2.p1  ORF type:complete len:179 (-),score=37.92 INCI14597.2:1006-1542(-)
MRGLFALLLACVCLLGGLGGSGDSSSLGLSVVAAGGKDRWFSVTDEATGKIYFWNKANGETTWTRPQGVKVSSGVKYHKHKKSRKNARTAAPPASKAEQRRAAEAKAREEAEAKAEAAAGSDEFELLDDEGDLIPPPPPAISYVLIAVGVLGLGVVGAAFFVNSRRDAKLAQQMYRDR